MNGISLLSSPAILPNSAHDDVGEGGCGCSCGGCDNDRHCCNRSRGCKK